MAPRLMRWALVAAAGSLLAIWLLLPSGKSILYWYARADESKGTSLEERRWAVTNARLAAQRELERRRQTAAFVEVARSARGRGDDPAVFAPDAPSRLARPAVEKEISTLWGQLPTRDPRLVTIVGLSADWNWWFDFPIAEGNDSLCFVRLVDVNANRRIEGNLARTAGKCALRERFGPPGAAWGRWLDSTRQLQVDLTRGPYTRLASTVEEPRPWFGWVGGRRGAWDNWSLNRQDERVFVACAGGDPVSCRSSFGIEAPRVDRENVGSVTLYSWGWTLDTRGSLPGAIYRDLGAEDFARLWRTDTTIAAAYEQIRGKPIDGLLQRLAYSMVGARPKDIGLSPLAWAGALIWAALLGAWAALRLRERRIGW